MLPGSHGAGWPLARQVDDRRRSIHRAAGVRTESNRLQTEATAERDSGYVASLANSRKMATDRASDSGRIEISAAALPDEGSKCLQKARRTSGPTRRSSKGHWTPEEVT
ncbi:hypothetical protein ACLOJK_020259 [Asimina triloba]